MIRSKKNEYKALLSSTTTTAIFKRRQIITGIVNDIYTMDPPGRFLLLKEDNIDNNSSGTTTTDMWFDIGVTKTLEKTRRALCENAAASDNIRQPTVMSSRSENSKIIIRVDGYSSTDSDIDGTRKRKRDNNKIYEDVIDELDKIINSSDKHHSISQSSCFDDTKRSFYNDKNNYNNTRSHDVSSRHSISFPRKTDMNDNNINVNNNASSATKDDNRQHHHCYQQQQSYPIQHPHPHLYFQSCHQARSLVQSQSQSQSQSHSQSQSQQSFSNSNPHEYKYDPSSTRNTNNINTKDNSALRHERQHPQYNNTLHHHLYPPP